MDALDKECLLDNHAYLLNEIHFVIDIILDYLYQWKVVGSGIFHDLKHHQSSMSKTRSLRLIQVNEKQEYLFTTKQRRIVSIRTEAIVLANRIISGLLALWALLLRAPQSSKPAMLMVKTLKTKFLCLYRSFIFQIHTEYFHHNFELISLENFNMQSVFL